MSRARQALVIPQPAPMPRPRLQEAPRRRDAWRTVGDVPDARAVLLLVRERLAAEARR